MSKDITIDDRIIQIVTPLKKERDALLEEREEIKADLYEVNLGIQKLERVIRTVDPEAIERNGKKPGPKPKTHYTPKPETIERVTKAVKKMNGKEFCAPMLEDFGVDKSTATHILPLLHEQGVIRHVGTKRRPGSTNGRAAKFYVEVKGRG